MKTILKFSCVFCLIIFYTYVCSITFLPSSYILLQGENLKINTLAGISVQEKNSGKTIQTVSNLNSERTNQVGKIDLSVSLFHLFPIKNISVNVIPKTTVIPCGSAIGMKLYTEGVLVVGMSEIEGKKPYENSGIQQGDRIVEINQNEIGSTQDLMQAVNRLQRKRN